MVDENIEKSLKRFLKRKVSVNESVVVKFLITGLIGATLTACGGGGGGGGSSSGGVTPLPPVEPKPPIVEPEKPQVSKPVENVLGSEINGENVVIQGNGKENSFSESGKSAISVVNNSKVTNESNLTVSGENATAISAVNSTVDNKANITLSGEGATALKGEVDTVLRNKAFEISIQNNGTIDLEGRRNIGLLILSKSGLISGMNNGTINANNGFEIDDSPENEVLDNNFWRDYLKDYSFGMVGVGDGSKIINSSKGTINVSGSSIGMYTKNGTAINEGTINIKGEKPNDKKEYKIPIGMVAEGQNAEATNNGTIIGTNNDVYGNFNNTQGMFAYDGGTVINGEKGKITLTGKAFASGLRGFNGNVINKGNIFVNGFGIEVFNGTAINDGTIKVSGYYTRGVHSGNSNVTNNGNIFAEGDCTSGLYGAINEIYPLKEITLTNGANGNIFIKGNNAYGMDIHESTYTAINNGNIEVTGDSSDGMYSYKGKLFNNKNITVKGNNSSGMSVALNATATNNGNIDITGNNNFGMSAEENSFITNESSGIINLTGGNTYGMNSLGNNVAIKNNGDINLKFDISNFDSNYSENIGINSEGNNNTIENNGNIKLDLNGSNSKVERLDNSGISVEGINNTIKNNGKIEISGNINQIFSDWIDFSGIKSYGYTEGKNESLIENGKDGEIIIDIKNPLDCKNITVVGINSTLNNTTINNLGNIAISGAKNATGIMGNNGIITNKKSGVIELNGDYVTGIRGTNSQITNDGDILITSKNLGGYPNNGEQHSTGIYLGENDGTATAKNSGNITMTGNKSVGIYAYNGKIGNSGKISVTGDMGTGLYISGNNGSAINSGEITVNGKDSDGMLAELKTTATNNGIITVIGNNSSGMTAEQGATVINNSDGTINIDGENSFGMKANGTGSSATNKGIINVGANASGGMLATGGATISNEGTINIDSSHGLNDGNKKDFALQTQGEGSTIENTGTIKADGTVTVTSGTNYVLGTTKSGSYGRISAKSINLDGNVIVDSTIASVDFKDSYTLDNAISSEETKLGKDFKVLSNTLLYDATAKKDDSKNNVDVELSRNENNLVDFTSKEYDGLASIFDKGINDKEFRDTLSDEAKEVLNNVFANTTSGQNIQNRLKEISGVEYTNIARQIFDTKDIFKSYDSSIINTLDDYQFNFNFIGNYSDVEAKGNLLGYESQMTGISGAMKFNDSLYGVIGYGYNDIDFDGKSEGNIKSVHTGIYKDMKLNSFDVRLGVFGEYNFHEVERDLTNKIAKGDFNSYLLGACGEISQRFGDSLYVKPTLSLDVTYGKYEDFTEEGAKGYNFAVDSQDYTSIVPAVEVKVGKDFEMASIYSAVKFGYEFGDMNKLQYAKLGEFDKKALPFTDEIENAQTDVKVGTAFEINNFTFNAEVGKEFGKRDREYITAGFTYTF